MLLNILRLNILNNYKEITKYTYQEIKEIRYIYTEDENITINTPLENINYKRTDNVIDMNNYYPIYSIKITGTNNLKLSDKNDFEDKIFAYCSSDNNIITIDNCEFISPVWNIIKSNKKLDETKYLKKYSSFVEFEQ